MSLKIFKNKYFYIFSLMVLLLPFIFVAVFYIVANRTGLEGKRGGPQDAFRHTYASAFTARYFSPKFVVLVTMLSERDVYSEYDQMDIHNNRLGINIGLSKTKNLYQTVFEKVKEAEVKPKNSDIIFILDKSKWQKSDF